MERLTPEQVKQLHSLPVDKLIAYWDALEARGKAQKVLPLAVRILCLADLYYLLVRVWPVRHAAEDRETRVCR